MSAQSRSASPSVDIVVPCYNYGHLLPQCVNSVLGQAGVEVRILVIDDCSTDDSAEVAERLAERDNRIIVHRHEANRGHIATYNEGLLGWADRDYVALLSADDLLAPGALARATAIMGQDPRIGMVYGPAPYFEVADDLPRFRTRASRPDRWDGRTWIEGRCRDARNVISSPEALVRTTVQHEVGGYRPTLPHSGDLEMWLRIAAVSDIGFVRGHPQAFYRVHQASMQRTTFASSLDDLVQRGAAFSAFFESNSERVPRADELNHMARLKLAREAIWRACRAYDRDALSVVPVEELVEFAISTASDVTSTREYRALERRRRLGARFCHGTQLFALSAVKRRIHDTYRIARWKRRGT